MLIAFIIANTPLLALSLTLIRYITSSTGPLPILGNKWWIKCVALHFIQILVGCDAGCW